MDWNIAKWLAIKYVEYNIKPLRGCLGLIDVRGKLVSDGVSCALGVMLHNKTRTDGWTRFDVNPYFGNIVGLVQSFDDGRLYYAILEEIRKLSETQS